MRVNAYCDIRQPGAWNEWPPVILQTCKYHYSEKISMKSVYWSISQTVALLSFGI